MFSCKHFEDPPCRECDIERATAPPIKFTGEVVIVDRIEVPDSDPGMMYIRALMAGKRAALRRELELMRVLAAQP